MGAFAVANSQFIADTVSFYRYNPTDRIAALVTDTGMSDKGKFFFYMSQPSLEDAPSFNQACERIETAVLGCYDGRKIFIYDVTDERLAGVRAVTAAHEMLHAVYSRLSKSDRQMVDQLLDVEYQRLKHDNAFMERMAIYERNEPGEHANELHSIIGTEVANISPKLEEYYKRYFSDRSKVVTLHQEYKSLFDELKAQAAELNRQIDAIDESIRANSASYNSEVAAVQQAISDFNNKARRGGFDSQEAFDSERQRLVARMSALEDVRAQIESDIERYNQLVAERNSIATEANELNRSLDSTLAPLPSI